MSAEDSLVPVVAILLIFGGPIAAFIVWRVLAHQERMEMIRRGMQPIDPRAMKQAMKYGWPGPVPPGAMPPTGGGAPINYGYDPSFFAQVQLRRGMQVTFVGLALLIGLSFIGFHGDGPPRYGPWLLGGLIPMFVGLAQVITALIGGARIGGFGGGAAQSYGPPPGVGAAPPPPGPAAAPQAPGGPFGWRPGPTPEIEKPASPPDYR